MGSTGWQMRDPRRTTARDALVARAVAMLVACVLATLVALPSAAVVFVSGDGTGNLTAPPDDFGLAHVGKAGGLTAVYVGGGWVLTADHVAVQDVTFGGVVYPGVIGSKPPHFLGALSLRNGRAPGCCIPVPQRVR